MIRSRSNLSDGMTEDIIAALSKFTKLSVVARNSTFSYKGKPVDIREIGKELGARYVLEGILTCATAAFGQTTCV